MKKMIGRIVSLFVVTMMLTTTAAIDAYAAGTNENPYGYVHTVSYWNFPTDVVALIRGEGMVYGMVGSADAAPSSWSMGDSVYANIFAKTEDVCVYFRAEAQEGWRFVHWIDVDTGEVYSTDKVIEFKPGSKNHLVALFVQ